MLVAGIIALFTALFLGGPTELFFVDNLEKGVKKYVVEKDRKKDILSDIKEAKSIFKDFEKERKKDYKNFLNLYTDRNTTTDEINTFFEDLQDKRNGFQNIIVDQRLIIFGKIKVEEWESIVETSVTVADKRIAKFEKKALKSREYFTKTKAKIESLITNSEKREIIFKGLEEVTNSVKKLESTLFSVNTSNNNILADKNSGRAELLEIVAEDNMNRIPVYASFVSFHKILNDNCSDAEWDKIMKSFTKEMQMSSK